MMYKSIAPNIANPAFQTVANWIAQSGEIRMPRAVPMIDLYSDHLMLQTVPRRPKSKYTPNQCWFNCEQYVRENPQVAMVFGWNIFEMKSDDGKFAFAAVHHTVIREGGKLVDITSRVDADADPISIFLPDARVPFDFEKFRRPLALFGHAPGSKWEFFWTQDTAEPFAHRIPQYGIAIAV